MDEGGKLTNRKHMMAMDPMSSIKSMSLKNTSEEQAPFRKQPSQSVKDKKPSEMPEDFKKKVKNPTYMAESYEYLAEQNQKVSKGFDKASVFKQRKNPEPVVKQEQRSEASEESAFVKAD